MNKNNLNINGFLKINLGVIFYSLVFVNCSTNSNNTTPQSPTTLLSPSIPQSPTTLLSPTIPQSPTTLLSPTIPQSPSTTDNSTLSKIEPSCNQNQEKVGSICIDVFTVSFNLGMGNTETLQNIPNQKPGTNVTLPQPTITGFNFKGWLYNNKINLTNFLMPAQNATLTALWSTLYGSEEAVSNGGDGLLEIYNINDLYNVRFNLNGTSWKTSQTDTVWRTAGCPVSGCKGYKLMASLDFNNDNGVATRWSSNCISGNSVTCVANGWEPINYCGSSNDCYTAADKLPFAATFNGKGFTINNLYIKNSGLLRFAGLFGYTNTKATIENLGLINVYIDALSSHQTEIGGIIGYKENGSITNSYVTGYLATSCSFDPPKMGALVGKQNGGQISFSWASANLTTAKQNNCGLSVGGLVGSHIDGDIRESTYTGQINSNLDSGAINYIGGIVGDFSNGSLTKNQAKAIININSSISLSPGDSTTASIGGIIGRMYTLSSTRNCIMNESNFNGVINYESNSIKNTVYIGGLVGEMGANNSTSEINYSTVHGSITSNIKNIYSNSDSYAGGLVGIVKKGEINFSAAFGQVSASSAKNAYAGGLVARSAIGNIKNSYAKNIVYSFANLNSYSGGLIAYKENGEIKNSYTLNWVTANSYNGSGTIFPNSYSGGIVAWNSSGNISNCFSQSQVEAYADGFTSNTVLFNSYSGGIVGNLVFGNIDKSYTTGRVISQKLTSGVFKADGDKASIVAVVGASSNITNSFWDTTTTGLTFGGLISISSNGLSTQNMVSTSGSITGLGNQFYHFTGNSYPKLCVTPLSTGATCTSMDYLPGQ